MEIKDIWGKIVIDEKYEQIINCKEFQELKVKNQLGLNTNVGAIHTRFEHSIGTYHLAKKLIEVCKEKFANVLEIKEEDENAIKCAALLHDLGHGVFSHVSEKHLKGSHEDRTVEIILDNKSNINQVLKDNFGEEVIRKIIYLINLKENINGEETDYNCDLLFIVKRLLSGGIDIDRIDYILRDSVYTKGEYNDFSCILEGINLEFINNSLEIVFDDSMLYSISNFFNKRFELYDTCYVEKTTLILEQVFARFLKKTQTKITWNTTEDEINRIIRNNLKNKDYYIKRYAEILKEKRLDEKFILKEFTDENSYSVFLKQLLEMYPFLNQLETPVFTSSASISIYNKKNKILVNRHGIIYDISEISKILNSNLKKEKYVVSIDLVILKELLRRSNIGETEIEKITDKIKDYFGNQVEQEKKYCFNEISVNPVEEFKLIRNALKLDNPEYIENEDIYYEDVEGLLELNNVSVRRRKINNKEEWTIKRTLNDKTSILKREERNFVCMEQVMYFLKHNLNLPVKELQEKIKLYTKRVKYDKELYGGVFEIVFDKTTGEINGTKQDSSYMIECELKEGKSVGLYFINNVIKKFPFIVDSSLSKKEIALNSIKESKKIKVKKQGEIYD